MLPGGNLKCGLLGPSYQSSQSFVFSNAPVTGLSVAFITRAPLVDILEPHFFRWLAQCGCVVTVAIDDHDLPRAVRRQVLCD